MARIRLAHYCYISQNGRSHRQLLPRVPTPSLTASHSLVCARIVGLCRRPTVSCLSLCLHAKKSVDAFLLIVARHSPTLGLNWPVHPAQAVCPVLCFTAPCPRLQKLLQTGNRVTRRCGAVRAVHFDVKTLEISIFENLATARASALRC